MVLLIVLLAHVTMIFIKSFFLSKMHSTTSKVATGAGLDVRTLPCIFIAVFLHSTFCSLKNHTQYCFLVCICHFGHWLGKVCFPVNHEVADKGRGSQGDWVGTGMLSLVT